MRPSDIEWEPGMTGAWTALGMVGDRGAEAEYKFGKR